MKNLLLTIIVAVFVNSSCVQKKYEVAPGELDIQSMIQPILPEIQTMNDLVSGFGSHNYWIQ